MSATIIIKALREAETYIGDPTVALAKTRFVSEALTKLLMAWSRMPPVHDEKQYQRVNRLLGGGIISGESAKRLERLWELGHQAVHEQRGTPDEAAEALKTATILVETCLGKVAANTPVIATAPAANLSVHTRAASMGSVKERVKRVQYSRRKPKAVFIAPLPRSAGIVTVKQHFSSLVLLVLFLLPGVLITSGIYKGVSWLTSGSNPAVAEPVKAEAPPPAANSDEMVTDQAFQPVYQSNDA